MNRETAHTYYWLYLGHKEWSQWSTRFDGRSSQWLSAVWSVCRSQVKANDPLTKGLPPFEATFSSLVGWQGWGEGVVGSFTWGSAVQYSWYWGLAWSAAECAQGTYEHLWRKQNYTDRHQKPIYSGVLSKCRVTWGTLQELRVRLNLMSTSSRNNFGSDL